MGLLRMRRAAVPVLTGGGEAARSYATILHEDYGADEVWPLVDIASGTTIHAHVNGNRDGSLTGWDLQNAAGPVTGTQAPYSDGANDYGDIYTSNGSDGLNDIFDGGVGSIFMWLQTSSWTDGNYGVGLILYVDSGNSLALRKQNVNNEYYWRYEAGGTGHTHTKSVSPADWFSVGLSWNKDAGASGEVKFFWNGAQDGPTATGLGVWSGSLVSTRCSIGSAFGNGANNPWDGLLAYAAVKFGSIWTPTDFANMHAAATDANTTGD
jgi:hypothetical protein